MESTFVSSAPTPTLSTNFLTTLSKLSEIGAAYRLPKVRARTELPCSRSRRRFNETDAFRFQGNPQRVSRQCDLQVVETRLALRKDSRLASTKRKFQQDASALSLGRSATAVQRLHFTFLHSSRTTFN
jgi:hypothetical protein